ncbi:MAG TPA: hypothetical protein RMH99_06730 [Sandaracinaceae bacterium LLY-WYZ-13_1]|nr:hypothetical protein [Sandaracinaceae bacterium LLY-WYZ-13_1]
MRVWPVVAGCSMIAFGLLAWLGGSLTGAAAAGVSALFETLVGLPGALLVVGIVLLLWGFTEDDARKR